MGGCSLLVVFSHMLSSILLRHRHFKRVGFYCESNSYTFSCFEATSFYIIEMYVLPAPFLYSLFECQVYKEMCSLPATLECDAHCGFNTYEARRACYRV